MFAFLGGARGLAAFAFTLSAFVACSSDDAAPNPPDTGAGGDAQAGAGSGGTGGGSAGKGGSGGTSGGAGQACIPEETTGNVPEAGAGGEAGASGATGEAGAAGAAGDAGTTSGRLPWLHTEGNELKDPSGNSVILRGVDMIDLAATEEWEDGIHTMIDRLTNRCDSQGSSPGWSTKILRLAVVPDGTDTGTPRPYTPGSHYYEDILRPTVDYATQKGLYVIIDWHYIDGTAAHIDETAAFWHDIAPHFAHDSNVFFELFNEPTNGGDWLTTKLDMQGWYDIVHKDAPNNIVLVGTPNWSQLVGDAALDPLDGSNIMYVAHMYPQHWKLPYLRDQITTAAALVPVFVSEWGFHEDPTDDLLNGTVTSYGDPFKGFLEENRLSWSAWCASASWGPPMFNDDYSLRVGEGEMGGFVKDFLYEKRSDDQPAR